ncbi:MAG: four helix bundle protein, partial [Oscillospiraceae bacterium]|nr:four helix bundle protein [Oscillospiraceae bacterium]
LKECRESIYWLKILKNTQLIEHAEKYIKLAEEIKAMLISSLNTAKNNMQLFCQTLVRKN